MKRLIPSLVELYPSPLGDLTLAADAEGLIGAWFEGQKHHGSVGTAGAALDENMPSMYRTARLSREDSRAARKALDAALDWLDAYFSGRDLGALPPLHLMGSAFQRAVWARLAGIPYGETTTYGAIANELASAKRAEAASRGGDPSAARVSARAVGGAVGRNPVSVIVPCHRVLGADGSITGYAGGLDCKRALLNLESDAQHCWITKVGARS
ncbi:MAG TPA: methylated-DNA--[protein]-cysteine S-methyltransferase [Candidatus Coprousia avicola]|nr:methylated-DNA--[protein]-cysteine S-methyltransferase [Candidatus Coprousia avicola]